MYKVFTRTWWKENSEYPKGLEPHLGRKHTLNAFVATETEARAICKKWNSTHKTGRYSKMAEYEER